MTRQKEIVEGFELSPEQKKICLNDNFRDITVGNAWFIDGTLDVKLFETALRKTVDNNESLRTDLQNLAGLDFPFQVINKSGNIDFQFIEKFDKNELENFRQNLFSEKADPKTENKIKVRLIELKETYYWFAITIPAMFADRKSFQNILSETAGFYLSGLKKIENKEAEKVQFVQYSEWQNDCLGEESDASEAGKAFWKNIESLDIQKLKLPEDVKSGEEQTGFLNSVETLQLGEKFVKDFSANVTKNITAGLAAAWEVLISKLTNRDKFILEFVSRDRKFEELNEVVGLLSKTIPLYCEVYRDFGFNEYLAESAKQFADSVEWQEYFSGFDFNAKENAGKNEKFASEQINIGVEISEMPEIIEFENLKFIQDKSSFNAQKLILKLNILKLENKTNLEFHYDNNHFSKDSILRLKEYFYHLLSNLIHTKGNSQISELEILPDSEIHKISVEWNSNKQNLTENQNVKSLFESQAKKTPKAIAVEFGDLKISFGDLNKQANRISYLLGKKGISAEDKIGITCERSIELIAVILGIIKTGAAYVPFDMSDAANRVKYVLENSGVKLLVSNDIESLEKFAVQAEKIALNELIEESEKEKAANRKITVNSENLAYLIYTSGSTGLPKGTLITQKGLNNYLAWAADYYADSQKIDTLLHTPLVFDLSVTSLFLPLITGGTIYLAPNENPSDSLIKGLKNWKPENPLLKITPAHLEILEDFAKQGEILNVGRKIIVGGEALYKDSLDFWFKKDDSIIFYNEYGPTETVVGCSVEKINSENDLHGVLPIGVPVANLQMYVLNEKMKVVPVGMTGEIFIGGFGLARGYRNSPDLTAEKFVPNPFDENGSRLYRTGDVGKYLPNGKIIYLGRNDDQVKIYGHRIELGEIESAILRHEQIKDAVVLAAENETEKAGKRLIAFVVGNGKNLKIDWNSFLTDFIPDYMIPGSFIEVDEIPISKNGKVDRKQLLAIEAKPVREEIESPTNLKEEVLTSIWSEVLGRETVGINQNFFDLGGDSMRSIQISARAKKRGLDIEHEQLFNYRTIKELAKHLNFNGDKSEPKKELANFELVSEKDLDAIPSGIEDAFPLAMLQAGMIFHSELNPEAAIFHDVHSFHINAHFDEVLMRTALKCLIERHDILRVSFDLSNYSQPLQLLHKNLEIPLMIEDIGELDNEAQEEKLNNWSIEDRKDHFDWKIAPLLRFHVHLRGEDSFQFTMSFHHAILDGWSAASLLTELFKSYLSLLKDSETPGGRKIKSFIQGFYSSRTGNSQFG